MRRRTDPFAPLLGYFFLVVGALALSACGGSQPAERGGTFERGSEDELYRDGIRSMRAGDMPAAERSLVSATEANPRFLAAWLALGRLYLDTGRPEAAETAFERATAIRARDVDAQIGLADARLRLGNPAGAAEAASSGAELASAAHLPDLESEGLRLLAQARLMLGEPEAAASALEEALEVDSTNVRARIDLAYTYDALRRRPDAVRLLSAAALSTEDVALLEEIGLAQAGMGASDRALDTLQRAHEGAPERVTLTTALAEAHLDAGNRDLAIQLATQALRQEPDHVPALILRGRAELLRGSLPRSRADAQAVLDRQPEHYEALVLLGTIERRAGNFPAAEQAFRRAIAQEPQRRSAFHELVEHFRGLSEHEALVALIEESQDGRELEYDWLIAYGNALAAIDRHEDALRVHSPAALSQRSRAGLHLEIVQRALAHPGVLDPEVVVTHAQEAYSSPDATGLEYRIALIDALRAAGRVEDARRLVTEGLRAYPNNPPLQERARILQR